MNRTMTAVFTVLLVSILTMFAAPVHAQGQTEMPLGEHMNGSLGFHNVDAPVGLRWWFSGQKIGLDLGFGFQSTPSTLYSSEKLTGWTIEAGVPLVMKSWNRLHLIARPGFIYHSEQIEATAPPDPFDTEDITAYSITGEIEAEAFLVDNFSVSASHGIQYNSVNPPGSGDNITSFGTIGGNFTTVGFHVYFFGGSR